MDSSVRKTYVVAGTGVETTDEVELELPGKQEASLLALTVI